MWTNGESISYYHRKDPNYFEDIPNKIELGDIIQKEYGIACFTKSMQSPVMWSTCYGNDHNSICVKFEILSERLLAIYKEPKANNKTEQIIDLFCADSNNLKDYNMWGNIAYSHDYDSAGNPNEYLDTTYFYFTLRDY